MTHSLIKLNPERSIMAKSSIDAVEKCRNKPSLIRVKFALLAASGGGHKLPVSDWEGLRPRLTEFARLCSTGLRQPLVAHRVSTCLPGSGALGFEALSRGADDCLFVDNNARGCRSLNELIEQLGARNRASVFCGDALRAPLEENNCDIVFIDPPFGTGLSIPASSGLVKGAVVKRALIYVETERVSQLKCAVTSLTEKENCWRSLFPTLRARIHDMVCLFGKACVGFEQLKARTV